MNLSKGLNSEYWTAEQIEAHCKAIGADKPPEKPKTGLGITASQMVQGSNHYSRSGGEW